MEYQKEADLFCSLSHQQGLALEDRDYKEANIYSHQLENWIKANADNAKLKTALEDKLDHPDTGIQFWTAYFLLNHRPDKSVAVLKKLSEEESPIGIDAKYLLKEYQSGELDP